MSVREHLDRLFLRYPDLSPCRVEVEQAFDILCHTFRQRGKLLICGNGGSAADGEHMVGELMKGFLHPRPVDEKTKLKLVEAYAADGVYLGERLQGALPAIALTSHASLTSAIANDIAPDMIFAQQVFGYGAAGDALLAISTSGSSRNVLNAVKVGHALDMQTIGLTGAGGECLAELCDRTIHVPYRGVIEIQERHEAIYHALCAMLEAAFFGSIDDTGC